MPTVNIPDHWSPEEALAVYEFIQDLLESIWGYYDLRLIELLQSQRIYETDRSQLDLFQPNDEFPF